MGTERVNPKDRLTPYQSISIHTRNIKTYDIKDITNVPSLIGALRNWNLHGSANGLENWVQEMHHQMDAEWDALPLESLEDWHDMEASFEQLRYQKG